MIDVVCGVAKRKGKILIAKRGKEPNYGKWEFPGGKVKAGETLQQAMVREFWEELQVKAEIKSKIYENNVEIEGTYFRLHFFYIDIGEEPIHLNEHLDYKWVHINEITSHKLCDGDQPVAIVLKELNLP